MTTVTSSNQKLDNRLWQSTACLSSSSSTVYHASRLDSTERLKYGWKSFRPNAFQGFNTPRWFLVFLCCLILTQGMMVNGLKSLVISTLEKRFDLSSTEAGIISSANEVTLAFLGVYVSYFGARGHRPKYLGIAALFISAGGIIFSLPHFIAGRYQAERGEFSKLPVVCGSKQTKELINYCAESPPASNLSVFLVFLTAQALIGIGISPIFTLGTAFIEESLDSKTSPIYLGVMYSTAALAPAVGFFIGGAFMNLFVDLDVETSLRPEDPRWIGAWWIGFLLCGVMAFICAWPLFGYPREIPGSTGITREVLTLNEHGINTENKSQAGAPYDSFTVSSHQLSAKNVWLVKLKLLPSKLCQLLSNLTFLFDIFAMALEKLLVFGLGVFFPKLIESQFGLTASESSIYTGLAVVPGIAGGTLAGGYLSAKMKSDPTKNAKFAFVVTLVTMAACGSLLIGCPDQKIAGVTEPYQGSENDFLRRTIAKVNMDSVCNSKCACAGVRNSPVCGSDDVTYVSPCHAGCQSRQANETKGYVNCTCIADAHEGRGTASDGKCRTYCSKLPLYLCGLFLVLFLTFLTEMPAITVLLKSVNPDQKSLSLGLQWLVVGAFGRIPGPVVFGRLIDNACLLWQDECGQRGSCVQYSNRQLTWLIVVSAVAIKGISTTLFFLSWFCYCPAVSRVSNPAAPINSIREEGRQLFEYETVV